MRANFTRAKMAEQPSLPNDILFMITEQTSDLQTLSNLINAHPTKLSPFLQRNFHRLILGTRGNDWPEELYHYACVSLKAEENPPDSMQAIKALMDDLIKGSAAIPFFDPLPPTTKSLNRLATLIDSIDFFLRFCPIMYLEHFSLECQTPLSSDEAFRMRRALLRLQLYAQLFHQPEATDAIISDRDWEQRPKLQQYFWTRFESVEVEECKCLYLLLVNVLVH